jgi:hypothetical protein
MAALMSIKIALTGYSGMMAIASPILSQREVTFAIYIMVVKFRNTI